MSVPEWDVFLSYARKDERVVARPLAELLRKRGLRVWIDAAELNLGDSLRAKIDEGLAKSRFGVVILSAAFFSKHWPLRELNGLAARESDGRKVILPVWHGVDHATVASQSPTLADRLAADTRNGLDLVATDIARAIAANDPAVRLQERVRRLVTDLNRPDTEDQLDASEALARIGTAAADAAPALFEAAIQTVDSVLRASLIKALKCVGGPPAAVVAEALTSPSPSARVSAAKVLEEVGPAAEGAIPALIRALADTDNSVQDSARLALARIGWAAVPSLIRVLRTSSPFPSNVVHTLILMRTFGGEPPEGVVSQIIDALVHSLDSRNAEVRVFAAMGLAMLRLDPARSTPALVGLLKDELPPVRCLASVGLGRMGNSAIGAMPLLAAALEDPDPDVRSAAGRAIEEIRATIPENSPSVSDRN
jgi:HEAT repeat protein